MGLFERIFGGERPSGREGSALSRSPALDVARALRDAVQEDLREFHGQVAVLQTCVDTLRNRVAEFEGWHKHRLARKALWEEVGAEGCYRYCSCTSCDNAPLRTETCPTCVKAGCPSGEPPQPEEVKL